MTDPEATGPRDAAPGGMPGPPDLPYNRVSWWLDRAVSRIGEWASWLWLAVLVVILVNVFSRFVLARGSIMLEELSWHLFGLTLMLTLAYAVVRDDHVRVDVLREKFSLRAQAVVELLAIVLLALPILWLMLENLFTNVETAYVRNETSQAPTVLPYRFLMKGTMPVGIGLIAVALFSRALRCCTLLLRFPSALTGDAGSAKPYH